MTCHQLRSGAVSSIWLNLMKLKLNTLSPFTNAAQLSLQSRWMVLAWFFQILLLNLDFPEHLTSTETLTFLLLLNVPNRRLYFCQEYMAISHHLICSVFLNLKFNPTLDIAPKFGEVIRAKSPDPSQFSILNLRALSHRSAFIFRTPRLWNSLPSFCFPSSYNLSHFKKSVNLLRKKIRWGIMWPHHGVGFPGLKSLKTYKR